MAARTMGLWTATIVGESMSPRKQGGFKTKGYRHLDTHVPRRAAEAILQASGGVSRHSFWPLLQFVKRTRKRKRDAGTGKLKVIWKERKIAFASHKDALVYGWYAARLQAKYEERLRVAGLSREAIAYRAGLGPTPAMAKEVFEHVQANPNHVAVCLDVHDFFGSLNHETLRQAWCDLEGQARLDGDAFAVFRSVTRYSFVDRDRLRLALGIGKRRAGIRRRIRQRRRPLAGARTGPMRSPPRICTAADFRALRRAASVTGQDKLVERHRGTAGIPQGLPISAVLSNIYLLRLDAAVASAVRSVGGLYRRYSDDILFVCPIEDVGAVYAVVASEMAAAGLALQETKTQVVDFAIRRTSADRVDGPPMQYLGLEFDGVQISIRGNSIQRFNSKLSRAATRYKLPVQAGSSDPHVHASGLFKRFTDRDRKAFNFTAYARLVARTTGDGTAVQQVSRASSRLRAILRRQ